MNTDRNIAEVNHRQDHPVTTQVHIYDAASIRWGDSHSSRQTRGTGFTGVCAQTPSGYFVDVLTRFWISPVGDRFTLDSDFNGTSTRTTHRSESLARDEAKRFLTRTRAKLLTQHLKTLDAERTRVLQELS